MDKYGVETDDSTEKVASDTGRRTCPRCGSPLMNEKKTNVSKCPKCGTEPFESK
jgi:ribosomal protein L37AE/L43A